jgi:predicted nucleotidyltransferase
MKSFFNETTLKIALIGCMIIGMIFLSNYQKKNLDFYVNDMSVMNANQIKNNIIDNTTNTTGKN